MRDVGIQTKRGATAGSGKCPRVYLALKFLLTAGAWDVGGALACVHDVPSMAKTLPLPVAKLNTHTHLALSGPTKYTDDCEP